MKKPIFAALFLMAALSLMSCTTIKAEVDIIFDESVPIEETSWINTDAVGNITSYNGITVEWPRDKIVQIPSGDTLLEFDMYGVIWGNSHKIVYGGTISSIQVKGALFRYNFQPGKIYRFQIKWEENIGYGLRVYDWDIGVKTLTFGAEHFVEFLPFSNASEWRLRWK